LNRIGRKRIKKLVRGLKSKNPMEFMLSRRIAIPAETRMRD
jgi:hypothetical protein